MSVNVLQWVTVALLLGFLQVASAAAPAPPMHVWEKVEITLHAEKAYANPYTEVEVWVDLKGPGFEKRCYGFWDGGATFRVRVLATAPGEWSWKSGSVPADPGLAGKSGSFSADVWTEKQLAENPCRRGMLKRSANGHAFEYADGTPFFLLGDTWWAVPTKRFRWYDDDTPRAIGPDAGFKDYVRFRRAQEFNCIAMIAAFPNWANDDKPAGLKMDDGTVLRSAWGQAGTKSAKDMTDEAGRRAFLFPGKVPGFENYFPDLDRINPAYFEGMDKKIDYLNSQGMIPFIEVARRDIGQGWKKYYAWPDSYTRYIRYIWSRYQANNCLFSPIHLDTPAQSIAVEDWNLAANKTIEKYGPPPFGTLCGTNSNPSSLVNWGHVDKARWLGFHQIGNRRTHDVYRYLTDIFAAAPPVPGINGEPYYDGMEDAEGGSEKAALYCRSAMYGSVLSGGLGGHIYGAGGWKGGLWSGEVETESQWPIWKVIQWPSADQMRHLKAFVLSEGRKYEDLVPAGDLVSPNRTGKPNTNVGWAYCARTADQKLFLVYFEKECPQATLSGALPGAKYQSRWFNPRTGRWAGTKILTAGADGKIALPPFSGGAETSDDDWALKLSLAAEAPAAAPPKEVSQTMFDEVQLTSAPCGHVLTNAGVFTPDSKWVVYDVRPDAEGAAFEGSRIERVNVETHKVEVLYESQSGARCGVATCNPRDDRVVFILGPENPTPEWSYSACHRQGAIVRAARPGVAENLESCDIIAPFTPGALRGGTHVHTFSGDGQWVSFTYNDHVLSQFAEAGADHDGDQRNVGVSAPVRPGKVKAGPRNHDGTMFAALVTKTTATPAPGSDEIAKACEDAWVGTNGYLRADGTRQQRAIAFQGEVRDRRGNPVSEVFTVDLPSDITVAGPDGPLEGTALRRPAPPQATVQRRLTHTADRKYPGIQGPRHWLRSSPDGSRIAYLAKDDAGIVQVWTVSPLGGEPVQVTRNQWPVASAFTWSHDGRRIAYAADGSIFVTDVGTGVSTRLTPPAEGRPILPLAVVYSPDGRSIAYLRRVAGEGGTFNQVFLLRTKG